MVCGTGRNPYIIGSAGVLSLADADALLGDGVGGGVYLWESRAAAEKVYTPAWRKMIADRYGAEPEILFFETPVVVDNVVSKVLTDAAQ